MRGHLREWVISLTKKNTKSYRRRLASSFLCFNRFSMAKVLKKGLFRLTRSNFERAAHSEQEATSSTTNFMSYYWIRSFASVAYPLKAPPDIDQNPRQMSVSRSYAFVNSICPFYFYPIPSILIEICNAMPADTSKSPSWPPTDVNIKTSRNST